MSILLDLLSRLGTFMLLFGILYFVYNFIFGSLFKLNKYTIFFNKFFLDDALSLIVALITILRFVEISSSYA